MSNPDKYHGRGGSYVMVNGVRVPAVEAEAAKAVKDAPAVEAAPEMQTRPAPSLLKR